jgi:hypothetical protein
MDQHDRIQVQIMYLTLQMDSQSKSGKKREHTLSPPLSLDAFHTQKNKIITKVDP